MRPLYSEPAKDDARRKDERRATSWVLAMVVGAVMLIASWPWHINWFGPRFKDVVIRARIKEIESYSHGDPWVILSDGRGLLLQLVTAGRHYVQAGDSLVKNAHSLNVTVYRRYPTYFDVRVFGYDGSDGRNDLDYPYSGLVQRYRRQLIVDSVRN